jgi:hypothetical protein
MPWTRLLLRLGLVAALVVPVAAARAADPKPEPCAGIFTTDPADDAVYSPGGSADVVGGLEDKAPDQLEVLNTFLNYKAGADGKKALTINITIKNLTRDVPTGLSSTGGNWYYGYFLYKDRVRYVRAANTGSGDITYAYGYVTSSTHGGDQAGGVYQKEGDTTGSFSEGPNGVVSIVIPEAIGGKAGETLGSVGGSAETIEGQDDFVGVNHQADTAPDKYSITDPAADLPGYTVAECSGSGAPAPTPAPGGGTTTPPTSGGGTTPPAAGPEALPFKAASSLGSAKKAKKKKSLSFKVTAGKAITNLKLALKPAKGGVAVGSATIKSLKAGTSTIKLKVKKLKAGKYVLAANGTVDGKTMGTTQAVTVKK